MAHTEIRADRFVVVEHERFAFVADSHATDANGTARVKKSDVDKWIDAYLGAEIDWDGAWWDQKRGHTNDGRFEIEWCGYEHYTVTDVRYTKSPVAHVDSTATAQLFTRQKSLWWHREIPSVGTRYAFYDFEGDRWIGEVITNVVHYMDNSVELHGHKGGKIQVVAPHGDLC